MSTEPLVLLHGFTDTSRAWRLVLPELGEDFAVHAPTLPGHHGGPPFDPEASFGPEAALDQLERMLDAEGIERAHLAGNSLGGWYALQLAARGRARSVTAICPAGGWEPGTREDRATIAFFTRTDRSMRVARPLLQTIARRPRLRALAMRELVPDPSRITASDAWAMMEGAMECAVLEESLEVARRGEAFGELGAIDVPVTVAYGTRDRLLRWPGHYPRLRRALPDARWVALEGCGHMPMWEVPERIAELVRETAALSSRARPASPASART